MRSWNNYINKKKTEEMNHFKIFFFSVQRNRTIYFQILLYYKIK